MADEARTSPTAFTAKLASPRTALIFAAGFLLSLFLARALPDVGLFHPEGRIRTIDVKITIASVTDDLNLSIGTDSGKGFGTLSEMWDGILLQEVKRLAGNPMSVPARITYVIPKEGPELPLFIRSPE